MSTNFSAFKKTAIPESELGNPFVPFKRFMEEAKEHDAKVSNVFSLATVTKDNKPDNRFMLAKEVGENGTLVFYTNEDSAKGDELRNNPNVSCNFYWPEMERSARVRGQVEYCSKEESDAYWETRPIASRVNAVISNQGNEMKDKDSFAKEVEERTKQAEKDGGIERPSNWHGYRVWADSIELWSEGSSDGNMHNRVQWDRSLTRKGKDIDDIQGFETGEWSHKMLQP